MTDGFALTLLVVLAAWVVLLAVLLYDRGRWSRASVRRNFVAGRGEDRAAALLQAWGAEIVGRQVVCHGWMEVDGEVVEYGVRADFVVQWEGERFVVEVKTGALAPDPLFAATRRQLREYAVLFELPVLLLDPEEETLQEVRFPHWGEMETRRRETAG